MTGTVPPFRHLDYGARPGLTEVGAAGIQAVLDRGDVGAWRPVLVAVQREPWGPVADRVERVVDHLESRGAACAWRAWLRRCRSQVGGLPASLTELRRQSGLSQQDLAMRLGVSQAQVARIEGAANPTVRSVARYLAALGRPLVALAARDSQGIRLVRAGGGATVDRLRQLAGKVDVHDDSPDLRRTCRPPSGKSPS